MKCGSGVRASPGAASLDGAAKTKFSWAFWHVCIAAPEGGRTPLARISPGKPFWTSPKACNIKEAADRDSPKTVLFIGGSMFAMFDLQEFAARYRLGLQDTASLVRAADDLLAEGHAEPAVVELSILESPIMAEAAPVFERACAQVGVTIPNKAEAIDALLRQYVAAIATGVRPPYEGLLTIMREIYFPHIAGEPCSKYVGDSHGIEHLIGAYWGYDDLIERPQEVSFEGKYGGEAFACLDEFVRRQSRDWLEKHKKHNGSNLDHQDMLTAESDVEL